MSDETPKYQAKIGERLLATFYCQFVLVNDQEIQARTMAFVPDELLRTFGEQLVVQGKSFIQKASPLILDPRRPS